jgi:hypothetical protein
LTEPSDEMFNETKKSKNKFTKNLGIENKKRNFQNEIGNCQTEFLQAEGDPSLQT